MKWAGVGVIGIVHFLRQGVEAREGCTVRSDSLSVVTDIPQKRVQSLIINRYRMYHTYPAYATRTACLNESADMTCEHADW